MTHQELQNGCLVTGYLNFFGRLTLNFDSIISADLGVMKTKENSTRITDWVSSHWIPQLLSSSDS